MKAWKTEYKIVEGTADEVVDKCNQLGLDGTWTWCGSLDYMDTYIKGLCMLN